jgi:predicted RNA-binding protein with RPS1 domain
LHCKFSMKKAKIFILFLVMSPAIILQAQNTKYALLGRAYYDGTSQIYHLDIVDDGSGNIKGTNISLLPDGRVLKGPIKGKINYSNHTITFQELRISNLSKGETEENFCFFTIMATFIIKNNKTEIVGIFTSKQHNGNACSNGTIKLTGGVNVEDVHKEYIAKIKKTASIKAQISKPIISEKKLKAIANSIKQKLNVTLPEKPKVTAVKDSTKEKQAPRDNNLIPVKTLPEYFYSNKKMMLEIKDYDKVDGDIISVLINNKVVIENYTLTATPQIIFIDLDEYGSKNGIDTLMLRAENEGYYAPNSGLVTLIDGSSRINFTTSANIGQRSFLVLRKKEE